MERFQAFLLLFMFLYFACYMLLAALIREIAAPDICGGTRNYLRRVTHVYPKGCAPIYI